MFLLERSILLDAILNGTAIALLESGANNINPGCEPCIGSLQCASADGETFISPPCGEISISQLDFLK